MTQADLIIRNARLIDGTGAASKHADLSISKGRVTRIGSDIHASGAEEIDAKGLALAPGFIDAHTHDDRAVLVDRDMACKVSQGVTTVVTGNCGISIAPLDIPDAPPAPINLICPGPDDLMSSFADYFKALEKTPPAVNVVPQVGHATLRAGVMDTFDRAATKSEIKKMQGSLRRALREGAAGFSTGLYYPPAREAPTQEIEALAQVVHEEGGFHSTHMRNEADGIMDSLEETFRIGRSADIPVVISHHKCVGPANHGRSVETLKAIANAQKSQEIGLDLYPYIASSTVLLKDKLEASSRVLITWSEKMPGVQGRDLQDVAAEMGLSSEEAVDALSPAGAVYFQMDEEDVRRIMSYPSTMIGSDGLPHDKHPHPRLWGTFPRVLGHYSRDVGLLPLETAVHKMTGLTARTFGLKDRGTLREGAWADIVLFDPETVIDTASFESPQTPADGIEQVYVNGRCVWRNGAPTGSHPGLGLNRQQHLKH